MMSRKGNALAACLLTAFCLSAVSCGPVFLHPLSDEKTSDRDDRLLGQWKWAEGQDVMLVTVAKGKGKSLDIKAVGSSSENPKEKEEYAFPIFTTKIGSQCFLTMQSMDADAKKPLNTYTIVRYDLPDQQTLEVRPMEDDRIAAAIQSKELQGTLVTKKTTSFLGGLISMIDETESITVSDSPENIARFLRKHGRDCFAHDPLFVFKKQR
ncbi:MAG: hypothetical protein ABFC96_08045 [Thermoguttaceae bacterium]